jgi:hypothetical protein
MRRLRILLALVLLAIIVPPAPAGIIFGRHAKPNPAQRVPELIALVKTDKSEGHRENAAKELRDYDPVAFPDIVPVLVDVLQHDPTVGVRVEAAQTLGRLRPVSQDAGAALETALKDSSIRVRMQARSSLVGYHLSGYRSDSRAVQIAPAPAPAAAPTVAAKTGGFSLNPLRRASVPTPTRTNFNSGETPPPPLAQPLIPAATPILQKPPAADAGPDLGPGKN